MYNIYLMELTASAEETFEYRYAESDFAVDLAMDEFTENHGLEGAEDVLVRAKITGEDKPADWIEVTVEAAACSVTIAEGEDEEEAAGNAWDEFCSARPYCMDWNWETKSLGSCAGDEDPTVLF